VEAAIGVHCASLGPRETTIERLRELDVVLAVAVVLPRRVEVAVTAIHGEPREVVRADVRAWDALLWPAPEITLRLAHEDIVADLARRAAVEVRRPGRGASGRVAEDAEVLRVGVVGRRVAVVEDHFEVAIGQHLRIRA